MNEEKVKVKVICNETINFDLLKVMELGAELFFLPEYGDILRARASETNVFHRRSGDSKRWKTNTGTSNLGYISVTRIN